MARLLCFAAVSLLCLSLYVQGARMVGGFERTNSNSPDVKKCAEFAADEINKQSNCLVVYGVVNVENVERQLVNGFNYKMNLTLRETVCRKNRKPSNPREGCPLLVGGEKEDQHCSVVVYTTLQGAPVELTKKDCTSTCDK